jgi:hypothetical protein
MTTHKSESGDPTACFPGDLAKAVVTPIKGGTKLSTMPLNRDGPARGSRRLEGTDEPAGDQLVSRGRLGHSARMLYNRICEGTIRPQKDGARTYITQAELERYVSSCGATPTNGRSGHAELRRPPP